MFRIILFQPEIPPNTGNIIRLCANCGAKLYLIEPLGFKLDDARLRRAGLDYHDLTDVIRFSSWKELRAELPQMRLWGFSTRGVNRYDQVQFKPEEGLVFGPETRGLPAEILEEIGTPRVVRLPMKDESRSLNLSNAVSVALYEALRQNGFGDLL